MYCRLGKQLGPLLVRDLPADVSFQLGVPFCLESAGYTDVYTFLQAWPTKVELARSSDGDVVSLVEK